MLLSATSGLAIVYAGAYQIRAIGHMSYPLLKHGREAIADAAFSRPFGNPGGFIAAAMYGLLVLLRRCSDRRWCGSGIRFAPSRLWRMYWECSI